MTVSSTELKTILIASGETSFSYWFAVESIDDVKVYFNIAGVDVLQEGYTVDSLDLEAGGNVIFDTAPAVGTKITIIRETSRTQDTNYVENDPFPAEAHEDALDKLTHIVQEQDEKMARCLRYPLSDTVQMSADLPELDRRKNKFLYFDQDGVLSPAEGQLIESTHTHTTFENLSLYGITYTYDLSYSQGDVLFRHGFNIVEDGFSGNGNISMSQCDMDLSGANIVVHADGTHNGDITADGTITSTSGVFTTLNATTLNATSFNVGTLSGTNLDVNGYITVGTNDGLKLSVASNVSMIDAQNASTSLNAKLLLRAKDSTDLGGAYHEYFYTSYDDTYLHTITLGGSVIGNTFRATNWDGSLPTFEGDGTVFLSARDDMIFSIDKNNLTTSGTYKWITNNWLTASGTTLMTLTESGILTVASGIYVGATEVSMDGHTHDDITSSITTVSGLLHDEIVLASGVLQDQIDLLYNYDDTTLSGVLHDEIVSASGVLQEQIDDITTSGVLYSPQVDTLYFGGPTTSGTFRMTTVSGNMELQWYDGIDWYNKTTWSGGIA